MGANDLEPMKKYASQSMPLDTRFVGGSTYALTFPFLVRKSPTQFPSAFLCGCGSHRVKGESGRNESTQVRKAIICIRIKYGSCDVEKRHVDDQILTTADHE